MLPFKEALLHHLSIRDLNAHLIKLSNKLHHRVLDPSLTESRHEKTCHMLLSRRQTTKALISLRKCAGFSALLLFAIAIFKIRTLACVIEQAGLCLTSSHSEDRFSRDGAQLQVTRNPLRSMLISVQTFCVAVFEENLNYSCMLKQWQDISQAEIWWYCWKEDYVTSIFLKPDQA